MIYEVDAGDEQEAQDKADMYLKNFNSIPIPDEYEVECLDEEQLRLYEDSWDNGITVYCITILTAEDMAK